MAPSPRRFARSARPASGRPQGPARGGNGKGALAVKGLPPGALPWIALPSVLALGALLLTLLGNPLGGNPQTWVHIGEAPLPPEDQLMAMIEDADAEPRVLLDPPKGPHGQPGTGKGAAAGPVITEDGEIVLVPAPDLDLVAEGQAGLLPVMAPDGRRASQVYARPFDQRDERPRIALVIGGLGLSKDATRHAISDLPPEVSLSFASHAEGLQSWVNRARGVGHEVLLEVPLEPFDYPDNDPGPFTLLTGAEPKDNIKRLDWLLSRFTGYIGIRTEQGARFTADAEALQSILAVLEARGLMLLDEGLSQLSQTGRIARQVSLPAITADRVIDAPPSRRTIDSMLLDLETIARNRGVAVGVGFAYPVSVEQIAAWAPTLRAKGLVLAPLSAALYGGPRGAS